eukprot:CAMPEP_0116039698 /NCGR_PEP_ID=MMETSP0321-20121206/23792_1 /TAXON_ID=163516 /ORGANISM="Leptocylindrus danicus var. danicus, Strain B650" /LENGTH=844 /DNA_ID=CAMNT_0003519119 /DNA_START=247 /DNA_END=2781 /DNA_ORIENTATION=+
MNPNETNSTVNEEESMIFNVNVARLCGHHRSKCGYCSGNRAPLLDQHLRQLGYDSDGDSCSQHDDEDDSNSCSDPGDSDDNSAAVGMEEDGDQSSNEQNKSNNSSQQKSKIQGSHLTARSKYNANNSSKSYGVLFDTLTCADYLHLMNHGWRRSGHHLYLPENWVSCCPAIPIRLNVEKFQMSKSQRKVWKRFEKSLSSSSSCSTEDATNGAVVPLGEAKRLKGTVSTTSQKKQKSFLKSSSAAQQREQLKVKLDDHNHFLPALQHAILQSVRRSCDDATLSNLFGDSNSNQTEQLLKLCLPKLSKHKSKPSKSKSSNSDSINDATSTKITTVYATTVCCAIAGRSRGAVQVQPLAKKVASELLQSLQTQQSLPFTVSGVEALPSGHVTIAMNVDVRVNVSDQQTLSAMEHDQDHQYDKQQQQDVVDRLAEALNLSPSNVNRPHKLTVRSLPLEVSKAMPEVHRLFAKYQEAIHGDANPYHAMDELARLDAVHHSEHMNAHNNSNFTSCSSPAESETADDSQSTTDSLLSSSDGSSSSCKSLGDRLRSMRHRRKSAERKLRDARQSFERFLCESPLPSSSSYSSYSSKTLTNSSFRTDDEGYDVRIPFGSYHQQYRIDGALIAVGVIDVLPTGISSVYSFYDPELSGGTLNLNLGKFTALREIEWVRRASKYRPNLKYYYLGFYIHSCQKMRYKAEYKPSELLCPVSKSWVEYERAKECLDQCSTHDYCSFVGMKNTSTAHSPSNGKSCNRSSNNVTKSVAGHQPPVCMYTSSGEYQSSVLVKRAVDSLRLEIGSVNDETGEMPTRLSMQMLSSHGKAIVGPLLTEFVEKIGTDVCQRSIIKLQ